jgi:hypothetical protein
MKCRKFFPFVRRRRFPEVATQNMKLHRLVFEPGTSHPQIQVTLLTTGCSLSIGVIRQGHQYTGPIRERDIYIYVHIV